MSMTITINVQPPNILVTLSGEFSLEEAKSSFLDIVSAIKDHKLGNVLLDGRGLTGEPRLLERFYYGHFAAEAIQGLRDRGWNGPDLRFAYVLEEPVLHRHRLGETTAASRGMNLRVFDDINEAVVWLLPNPANDKESADRPRRVVNLKPEH